MATWGSGISLKGGKGDSVLFGTGAPTAAGTVDQQLYIDTSAHNAYVWSASGAAWGAAIPLVGPMGLNGVDGAFFTGTGAPTAATYSGAGNAVYISSAGELYTYANGVWSDSATNLVGPAGPAGLRGSQLYQGSGPPPADLTTLTPTPAPRDMYFDTTNQIYYVLQG